MFHSLPCQQQSFTPPPRIMSLNDHEHEHIKLMELYMDLGLAKAQFELTLWHQAMTNFTALLHLGNQSNWCIRCRRARGELS